jgi:hypothetical protein
MNNQLELDWLAEERPEPLALDAETTGRVRAELLSRTEAGSPRRSRRRQRSLGIRPFRVAVSGAALAAVGCAALLATGGGSSNHPSSGISSLLSVQSASAKRLTRLSAKLVSDPAPVGDATLVLRTQTYPNSPTITGADLYADNGDYYYATTLSGLPSLIQDHETVDTDSSDSEVRDIAAAKAALTEPIDQARQAMSIATYAPGHVPNLSNSVQTKAQLAAQIAKLPSAERAQLDAKLAEVKRNAAAQDIQPVISQEDGMIWDNSMDALLAGAGDPQVREGVLDLLATIPQITVTNGTLNGNPTLVVTASLMTSKAGLYQETLVLDANTGIPVEFLGGNQGQTPSVTVTYTINRVTVASIENGSYTG